MTHFDGDVNEMPVSTLDDRALEALLGGGLPAQSGFDWLVPFVGELGEAASTPAPVVRPALALLLAQGFSIEKGDLSATAASNVTGPASQAAGLPKWRKKKMIISELLAGITTKLAGLGMAAKAGLGLTLAAASTTAAGAVGVLPAPAQHAVATVVSSATPFSFPDSASSHASVGANVSTDATGATKGVDGVAVSGAATSGGSGVGVGANTGATGLDRANQTPAAGNVPTSVPGPNTGATGLDRANQTPAAGHAPTSVPGPNSGSQASTGLDTAGSTPAAGHAPTSVPPVTSAPANGTGSQASTGLNTASSTPAASHVPASVPGRP